jgi:hypothetical protein
MNTFSAGQPPAEDLIRMVRLCTTGIAQAAELEKGLECSVFYGSRVFALY